MPLYEIHTSRKVHKRDFEPLYMCIANLHAYHFHVPAQSVRCDFITEYHPDAESAYGHRRFGGISGRKSHYIVIHMDYTGTQPEWEAYCVELMDAYNSFRAIKTGGFLLGDVYLQPMTYEFQVGIGLTAGGGVVRNVKETESKGKEVYREPQQPEQGEGSGAAEEPPAYQA